jgi:hypothetical protein
MIFLLLPVSVIWLSFKIGQKTTQLIDFALCRSAWWRARCTINGIKLIENRLIDDHHHYRTTGISQYLIYWRVRFAAMRLSIAEFLSRLCKCIHILYFVVQESNGNWRFFCRFLYHFFFQFHKLQFDCSC